MNVHFVCFLIILLPAFVFAQGSSKNEPGLSVRHVADFEVTGKGDAQAWGTTRWVTLSKRRGPADYLTRIKLLYSDSGIYGLFSCEDRKITATMNEDFLDLWTEDVIEIFLWPDESMSLYFEYELSPLNFELPILVPNLNGEYLGWRPWHYEGDRKTRHATKILYDAKGEVTEWRGEFFIPYALLKPLQNVPPEKGTEWRINMYRVDYDQEQPTSWVWKPITKNFHDYGKFGVIRFD